MGVKIFENDLVYIEYEESEIPWFIIFTRRKIKEFSQSTTAEKQAIFALLDLIEKEMLLYFKPTKINIASFGNMLPHLHWHIMARFEKDSYFPQPMWGEIQRKSDLNFPCIDIFIENLLKKLTNI